MATKPKSKPRKGKAAPRMLWNVCVPFEMRATARLYQQRVKPFVSDIRRLPDVVERGSR